jgi:ssRNA-specific RNase YbeY (16S rRNA maturation enzyme)
MAQDMISDVFDSEAGYQTCDLYLGAFFLSAGCKMLKSNRDRNTKRVYFVFEKNPLIQELKVKYFSREAKIDALSFSDNIKSLKSLCHNLTNGALAKV